jgi:serine/threonine protein kinase/outer membrane protein assembly factor BamB
MTMQPLERDDPRVAGEFRLRARLGSGGMGQVYLGYSPAGRAVAVKICHPEFAADPAFVARFAREVAAARSVNGLYTAQVIGAGPDDNPPWLATSYVPGPSLHQAVTGHGPLPGSAVWRLAAGLAEALQAVHAHGLVHRDLKPTNVLLAADGPRVIDFGIVSALDATSMTTTGYAFGTPGYMAPEQVAGQSATPASDVFALGSVLCFAATGDAPFGDGEPAAVMYRVVHDEPVLEIVPGALRGLVARCLAKDPVDRPTLGEVLRTCQTQAPGPSASFWPGQVAALIARYRAGLDSTAQALQPTSQPAGAPASQPSGETTQTIGGNLVAPDGYAPPSSDPAPSPAHRAVALLSRRQALAGLATAGVAAGLGVAGWAYARSASGHRSPAASSRLLWASETGGQVTSGAALADGILYIGSDDGKVHAFEAAGGRPVRTFPTSGAVSGGVSVAGGTLFAGSADHGVHAFRVGTGGKSWVYRTGGPVNCTPAVANGTVYSGSDDGDVHAIDAGTGRLSWRYGTGGPVRSGPRPGSQLYSGYVYAGSDDGHLYTLGTDGTLQWQFATGGPVTAGPVYGRGLVCVGDDNGHVFGIAGDGPALSWKDQFGGAVRGTPAFAGEFIYIGSADSIIRAVNMYGGAPFWQYPTAGPVNSGPATDGTTVYAGDDDGYLYAIDVISGSPRWRYRVGTAVRSQILLANGVIYFGSLDHHVYALRA